MNKPDRDGLQWSRICSGIIYDYAVCEDGRVIKCSRVHSVESAVKPYLHRGAATVRVNGKMFTLKNLVARHFIRGYHAGAPVECIDGNPFNCRVKNLRVYTMREHGQRTGGRNSRARKVVANGVEYRSVRECAKALFVSYQTVLDYIDGSVKRSVLQGVEIETSEP
jgi:hypothetical protein